MSKARRLALALSIAALAGCAGSLDLTNPRVVGEELRGTWSQVLSVPGAATVLELSVAGSIVSGSGSYAIEAGASGPLTVTGVISGSIITIQFTRSDGNVGHFHGQLISTDVLYGSLSYSTDPIVSEFRRTSH
jgi:hypothetical protein